MKVSVIEIHQTLHGYDRGHRQVSGSLLLSDKPRRQLDSLSDVSGSIVGVAPDIFPYITGYPLQEVQYYVLAKTWLAKNASRPGTVWTHSLLIPFVNLAKISSFAPLEEVFREPQGLSDQSVYSTPLKVTLPDGNPQHKFPSSAQEVLEALYSFSEQAVLVLDNKPKTLTPLVFAIWSQQWPRLRRTFTFCTGSFELRKLDGKFFDLQISHPSLNSSQKGPATVNLSNFSRGLFENNPPNTWSEILYQDLPKSSSNLKIFLLKFGAEFGSRSKMQILVKIYGYLNILPNTIALRKLITQALTDPELAEAGHLKEALLLNEVHGGLLPSICEYNSLYLIGTLRNTFLNSDSLQLIERVHSLSTKNNTLAARLIRSFTVNGNKNGQLMLRYLLKTISSESFKLAYKNNISLLLIAIKIYPELAFQEEVWSSSRNVQGGILNILLASSKEVDWWTPVLNAMLKSESSVGASKLFKHFGDTFAPIILDYYSKGKIVPQPWLDLASKPTNLVNWLLEHHDGELAQQENILKISNPDERPFHKIPISYWNILLQKLKAQEDQKYLTSYTFILCLSFWNPEGKADVLFMESLSPVLVALNKDSLDTVSKKWVMEKLSPKPLFYFGPYTSSTALLRAVVRSLIHHDFPPFPFINSLSKTEKSQLESLSESDWRIRKWIKDSEKEG